MNRKMEAIPPQRAFINESVNGGAGTASTSIHNVFWAYPKLQMSDNNFPNLPDENGEPGYIVRFMISPTIVDSGTSSGDKTPAVDLIMSVLPIVYANGLTRHGQLCFGTIGRRLFQPIRTFSDRAKNRDSYEVMKKKDGTYETARGSEFLPSRWSFYDWQVKFGVDESTIVNSAGVANPTPKIIKMDHYPSKPWRRYSDDMDGWCAIPYATSFSSPPAILSQINGYNYQDSLDFMKPVADQSYCDYEPCNWSADQLCKSVFLSGTGTGDRSYRKALWVATDFGATTNTWTLRPWWVEDLRPQEYSRPRVQQQASPGSLDFDYQAFLSGINSIFPDQNPYEPGYNSDVRFNLAKPDGSTYQEPPNTDFTAAAINSSRPRYFNGTGLDTFGISKGFYLKDLNTIVLNMHVSGKVKLEFTPTNDSSRTVVS